MNFNPQQAVELKTSLNKHGVDYLFLGKSGAILLGYPATTQDVDIFAPKNPENAGRLLKGLSDLGFRIPEEAARAILEGKDFIQLKDGPFDLDIIHAPDGIESYEKSKARSITTPDGFPVTGISDIIASKKAAGRAKDLADIALLEQFAEEYAKRHPKPLRSTHEILRHKPDSGLTAKKSNEQNGPAFP